MDAISHRRKTRDASRKSVFLSVAGLFSAGMTGRIWQSARHLLRLLSERLAYVELSASETSRSCAECLMTNAAKASRSRNFFRPERRLAKHWLQSDAETKTRRLGSVFLSECAMPLLQKSVYKPRTIHPKRLQVYTVSRAHVAVCLQVLPSAQVKRLRSRSTAVLDTCQILVRQSSACQPCLRCRQGSPSPVDVADIGMYSPVSGPFMHPPADVCLQRCSAGASTAPQPQPRLHLRG